MEKQNISEDSICNFLDDIADPSLTTEQLQSCEGNLRKKGIYNSLISFENNKSPGNDELTKEFYYTFWDDIKDTLKIKIYEIVERIKKAKIFLHFTATGNY